jgi:hypothetical protein
MHMESRATHRDSVVFSMGMSYTQRTALAQKHLSLLKKSIFGTDFACRD